MIAVGCLAPLVLLVCGALAGNLLAGPTAALWGAGIGFAVGLVVLGAFGWLGGKLRT